MRQLIEISTAASPNRENGSSCYYCHQPLDVRIITSPAGISVGLAHIGCDEIAEFTTIKISKSTAQRLGQLKAFPDLLSYDAVIRMLLDEHVKAWNEAHGQEIQKLMGE